MQRTAFKQLTALSFGAESHRAQHSTAAQDLHWVTRNIPCQAACPAGTDIPGYLEAVYHGRFREAYEINLRDNVFPGVLGRVCSRPCEGACRHGWQGNGESVAICFSKRAAADFHRSEPIRLPALFPATGKRVAVVGAGVAGLTVARELARFGHRVEIFERHSRAGGMLNQGIPAFRLPRDVIDFEVRQVLEHEITLHCGVQVGVDVKLAQLLHDFDSVVLAAGTLRPNVLPLPNAHLRGIEHGLPFLLAVNEHERLEIGRQVVVIGGGYTAMDCARTALRLGAERVGVYYRRGARDMVVLPGEVQELLEEGGKLHTESAPVDFTGADVVQSMHFVRTKAGAAGRDGRAQPVTIHDSAFEVEADSVILATGQFPDARWIDAALAPQLVAADGWLLSGAAHRTAHPKVFVAGDFALGATTLIQAIGHAKSCALEIDEYLVGMRRLDATVFAGASFQSKAHPSRTTGRTPQMNSIPLHPIPTLEVERRGMLQEVETGYDEPGALKAASRCYLCHYKFEINDAKCVLCDECLKVKPVPDCIVEIADLMRDDEGRVVGYQRVEPGRSDSLYYNRLWIDQNQCVRCGQCEAVCPVNAISIQKVSMQTRPV